MTKVPGIHDKAVLFCIVSGASLYFASLNRGSWRYASIPDLFAILKASFFATTSFTVILFFLSRADHLPRVVMPIAFMFMVFGLSGSRILYRVLQEYGYLSVGRKAALDIKQRSVLLYGVSENAESFIRAVRRSAHSPIKIRGILSDEYREGFQIQGIKVRGRHTNLDKIIEKLKAGGRGVDEVVITNPTIEKALVSDLVRKANAVGLKVSRIPDLSETASIDGGGIDPDPIQISDLLGRPEVDVDLAPVARLIASKTLLISGAGGSIGSELVRQISQFDPKRLVLIDISEHFLYTIDSKIREQFPDLEVIAKIADIRDRDRVNTLIERYKPEVVFHAAALKHVPLMENNILESIKTNILGTRNLADCAIAHGVKTFIMISTDKAVNPTNIMGATKRAAEAYCQSLDLNGSMTRFKTVRFGNVLGSNGSVVPRFEAQIARGGPVTVTHPDIVRYFMTIPEAVRLVLEASSHGMSRQKDRGRILVLNMGEPVRIVDLAEKMIELAGFRPHQDIKIEFVGLRPGEKLYEELFDRRETLDTTDNQNYFLATPRTIDSDTFADAIRGLEGAVSASSESCGVRCLLQIVPEYTPELNIEQDNVLHFAACSAE